MHLVVARGVPMPTGQALSVAAAIYEGCVVQHLGLAQRYAEAREG
jgi:hypothetical protein